MNEIKVGILPTSKEVAMSDIDSQEIALPNERGERGASEGFLAEYRIKLDETHLELPPDLDFEDFTSVCAQLNRFSRAMPWYIGDALLHGERAYGDAYYQASAEFDMRPETLMNYASICRWVPPEVRRADLSFTHHAPIAKLRKGGSKLSDPAVPDVKTQRYWLAQAVEHRWNRGELRAALAADAERTAPPATPAKQLAEVATGTPETQERHTRSAEEALRDILAAAVPVADAVKAALRYYAVPRETLKEAGVLIGVAVPRASFPSSDDDLAFSDPTVDTSIRAGLEVAE